MNADRWSHRRCTCCSPRQQLNQFSPSDAADNVVPEGFLSEAKRLMKPLADSFVISLKIKDGN
jgi:hypothetical protein